MAEKRYTFFPPDKGWNQPEKKQEHKTQTQQQAEQLLAKLEPWTTILNKDMCLREIETFLENLLNSKKE